mgnify:CR=1 FL=1
MWFFAEEGLNHEVIRSGKFKVKMDFQNKTNRPFNVFQALGWSIGAHIIFLNFLPAIQPIASPVLEKKFERVRLEIIEKIKPLEIIEKTNPLKKIEKNPLAEKPIQPVFRKMQVQKMSVLPVQVKQNQVIHAAVIKTSPQKLLNSLDVKPLRLSFPQADSIKVVSNPTKQHLVHHNQEHVPDRMKISPVSFSKSKKQLTGDTPFAARITSVSMRKFSSPSFTPVIRAVEEVKVTKEKGGNSLTEKDFKEVWSRYTHSIQVKIAKTKSYPSLAREKNQQGRAFLSFKLSKNGRVLELSVENSSGHEILDQAAIKAIEEAAPFPNIPETLNKDYALLKIPISFVLR